MARSSTPFARRRSSSRAGGVTTTPSDRMPRSATGRRPPRYLCQRWPHGRPRNPGQRRRPCYPWRPDPPSTNIKPGPLIGGRSSYERNEAAFAKGIVELRLNYLVGGEYLELTA